MKDCIKIAIAEPNEILRISLANLITGMNEFNVVHHHNNGKEFLKKLKVFLPQIVIMDTNLKQMDGYEIHSIIKNRFPDVKVIFFCTISNDELISKLFKAGANAVISKTSSLETLKNTIKEVSLNGLSITSAQKKILKDKYNSSRKLNSFSDREIQVMAEVCNGFTNKQISEKLFITSSTVDFHKQRIYKKTKTSSVLDLYKFALKNKLVKFDF